MRCASDPARAQEGLRAIVGQLGRTRRLTEQLLSLAHANQAESLPRQLLDMNDVSREVVLKYLPLAHEKQQDLGWSCAEAEDGVDTSLPVSGSEAELHEALSNLVHNAIHYAPAGARITVSVGRADGRVEVAVSDNGPGWIRSCARALRAFRACRHGPAGGRIVGFAWAWRSRGPMRAATTATSSCAMENPMARRRRPGIGAVAAAGADGVAVPPHRRDRTQGRSVVSSCFFLQLSMGWLPCSGITPGFRARQRRESGFAACLRNLTSSLQQWAGRRAFRAASQGPARVLLEEDGSAENNQQKRLLRRRPDGLDRTGGDLRRQ